MIANENLATISFVFSLKEICLFVWMFACFQEFPWDWGCSSVVEHLPSTHRALGMIPNNIKRTSLFSFDF
jgi:hypothetical protein